MFKDRRPEKIFLIILIIFTALLFKDSFTNFFFQDDFFNMNLSNGQSLISAFNLFHKPIMNFYFYRPLSTQLFWLVGQKLFGMNPIGYHLINFLFFAVNIVLVVRLAKTLGLKTRDRLLAGFFYALSGSNFYRLFFLSQFQETALASFVLLSVTAFISDSWLSLLWLVLALLSKETAVVIPGVLLLYRLLYKKGSAAKFSAAVSVVLLYLLTRKFFFGFAGGQAYAFDFHLKSIMNNYIWYFLWSLGIPEAFVNVRLFAGPTIINPQYFTKFGEWGARIVPVFLVFIAAQVFGVLRWIKKRKYIREVLFFSGFMVILLLPVAFFPFHKFAYSVTLPLAGASIILAIFSGYLDRVSLSAVLIIYLFLNLFSLNLNLLTHWSRLRAIDSEKVWTYLEREHPELGHGTHIVYFFEGNEMYCWPKTQVQWKSRDLGYSMGDLDSIKLLYNNPKLSVYYAGIDGYGKYYPGAEIINTKMVLNN